MNSEGKILETFAVIQLKTGKLMSFFWSATYLLWNKMWIIILNENETGYNYSKTKCPNMYLP
jgi:hypothetical protein